MKKIEMHSGYFCVEGAGGGVDNLRQAAKLAALDDLIRIVEKVANGQLTYETVESARNLLEDMERAKAV